APPGRDRADRRRLPAPRPTRPPGTGGLMSAPVVAVVGRPNVGKSTLVNRVLGRREAIVEERPGVTRDRRVVDAEWNGRRFDLVDTGGWLRSDDSLDRQVSLQAERAVAGADLVLVVVDVAVGPTAEDEQFARLLRRNGRPTLLVANKVDSETREADVWAFTRLGLGDPWGISALHGRGTGDLLDEVVSRLPAESDRTEAGEPASSETVESVDEGRGGMPAGASVPGVAIVGRPNVG